MIDACDQVNSSDLGQLARDGYQTPGRDPFSLVYLHLNTAHPNAQEYFGAPRHLPR